MRLAAFYFAHKNTRGSYGRSYKGRCVIEVLRQGARLICCYLQYIHASRNPRSAQAQARKIWLAMEGACRDSALVVAPCTFSGTVVTFHGRGEGHLVFWWSIVDFS